MSEKIRDKQKALDFLTSLLNEELSHDEIAAEKESLRQIMAALTHENGGQAPKCPICNDSGYYCTGRSGSESDGNAPILERCDCEAGQPQGGQESEAQAQAM